MSAYLPVRRAYDHDLYQAWQTPYARGASSACSRLSTASSGGCRGRSGVSDPVVSVEPRPSYCRFRQPLQIGPMTIAPREYATVRVLTAESGLVGKAYCLTRNAPVAEAVDRLFAPHVVGRDAGDIAGLPGAVPPCERDDRRAPGLAMRALGLVDVALWDIAAQREGVPLHRLSRPGGDTAESR